MAREPHNRRKLLMAGMSLAVAAAVLTTGTYAWYTLSTNPEISGIQFSIGGDDTMLISDDEARTFSRIVDISDDFGNIDLKMNTLRPVSTIDGLNWFVCEYDPATGNVVADDFYKMAWCVSEDHGQTEDPHIHCDNGGFYAYTDIWVKSTAKEADIRLAIPGTYVDTGQGEDPYHDETVAGSYVLSYATKEVTDPNTGATTETVQVLGQGPETCARVGLMVFEPTQETEDHMDAVVLQETEDAAEKIVTDEEGKDVPIPNTFYIYEPNADYRSELDKQSDDYRTDVYVSGFNVKQHAGIDYDASNGSYIQTYPIQADGAVPTGEDVQLGTTTEQGILMKASPAVFPTDRLIVQSRATWNTEAVKNIPSESLIIRSGGDVTKVFENLMKFPYVSLGEFVPQELTASKLYEGKTAGPDGAGKYTSVEGGNNDYNPVVMSTTGKPETDLAHDSASQVLFTLHEGEIRQIRLFFWIEGQDVDCWNDVSGMNFLARIEFSTDIKQE